MKRYKKIATALYLLLFVVYAISPLVASVPQVSTLRPVSGDGDPSFARLMLFELLSGGAADREAEMGAASDGDRDILLRKKRTIVSNKISLDAAAVEAPALPPPPVELLCVYQAAHHVHSSRTHFFISGISPPSLS